MDLALDLENELGHGALANLDRDLAHRTVGLLGRLPEGVGGADEELDLAIPHAEGAAEGAAEPELGHSQVEVHLGQQVLAGEGRCTAGVAHPIPRLLQLEAVLESPPYQHLDRLLFFLFSGRLEDDTLRLHRVVRREREDPPELLEGGLEGRRRADHTLACLGRLQLGPEDVELARHPHLQPRVGGVEQALGALQALVGHFEELALGDHGVEGAGDLHGQSLPGELEGALLHGHGALCVGEIEIGRVRSGASEERLAQQEPEVGAAGEERLHPFGRIRLGDVPARGDQGPPGPRESLGDVEAEERPAVTSGEKRHDLGEELPAGGGALPARGGDGGRGVEQREVLLERQADRTMEMERRRPRGRADRHLLLACAVLDLGRDGTGCLLRCRDEGALLGGGSSGSQQQGKNGKRGTGHGRI